MTDQEKEHLSPSEQIFADEITRTVNRQMQIVTRLDGIQEKLAQAVSVHELLDNRMKNLEEWQKKPASLMERILVPLMVFNLSITVGNVAMTLTVAIALANHMLSK
jgi:hypothetical protein